MGCHDDDVNHDDEKDNEEDVVQLLCYFCVYVIICLSQNNDIFH